MDSKMDLRLFRKANGVTQSAIAEYLGTTKQFISQVEAGKVALPEDKFMKILDNPDWSREKYFQLVETIDEMRRTVAPDKVEPAPVAGRDSDVPQRVRLIPFEARGGMIGDFVDGVHDYDCEMVVSPIKGVDFAMTVTGDSMAPEYNPGDRILIKRIDPNLFIEWGRVYVLDTPNGAVIKKLERSDEPGYVTCISINPDVSPFQVNVNAVRGWYRVLMVMSMK
jgi:phage repressor protein C with HTH and peptisase S24 domain